VVRRQRGQDPGRELIGVSPEWFAGREALDAGCGGGRWTLALLRLGARVTAVDFSARALGSTLEQMRRLVPEAVDAGRLELRKVNCSPSTRTSRRGDSISSSLSVSSTTPATRDPPWPTSPP
jgi:predicted RNA methylase